MRYVQGIQPNTPARRDSVNDFWVPEKGSDNSRFLFILFLYPHVVPSRFSKQLSFLGADFRFWSLLGLTRNGNVKRYHRVIHMLTLHVHVPM